MRSFSSLGALWARGCFKRTFPHTLHPTQSNESQHGGMWRPPAAPVGGALSYLALANAFDTLDDTVDKAALQLCFIALFHHQEMLAEVHEAFVLNLQQGTT